MDTFIIALAAFALGIGFGMSLQWRRNQARIDELERKAALQEELAYLGALTVVSEEGDATQLIRWLEEELGLENSRSKAL